MKAPRAASSALLVSSVLFSGFAAAHLIDEFLWGAPAEFNLSTESALVLAWLFMTALTGLVVGAGLGRQRSRAGLAIAGALIAVADVLRHTPEIGQQGTWRSGWLSSVLVFGLTASSLATAVTGSLAWWSGRESRPRA